MERGEVQGSGANWSTLKTIVPNWIAEKKIKSTDYVTGEAPLSKLKQVLQQMLERGSQIKTAIIPGH